MTVTKTFLGQEEQVASWLSGLGPDLRVGLYTSRTGSGKSVALGGLGLATFSGYSPIHPVFSTTGEDANNRMVNTAAAVTFAHSGGGVSNTILGWCIYNVATSTLHYYEDFGSTINMAASGNTITITPKLYYGDLTPPL